MFRFVQMWFENLAIIYYDLYMCVFLKAGSVV